MNYNGKVYAKIGDKYIEMALNSKDIDELERKAKLYDGINRIPMTKDELITKQQLKIEGFKSIAEDNKQLRDELIGKFFNMGQPLNDNILKFNRKQMEWCFEVVELVEKIEY